MKPLEVNPYVRYRLPRKRWQSVVMAGVWTVLVVLMAKDPDPLWLSIILWALSALMIWVNVYTAVRYNALKKQHDDAERARQQVRARYTHLDLFDGEN